MRWGAPLAWLLAIGILAPLAAHLLSRRPPGVRAFPTLQFLHGSTTSARRLHALHDVGLWSLRTVIVLLAAGAAAGPTLVTASRAAAWQAPLVRAMVTAPGVDVAASVADAPTSADVRLWSYTDRPLRASLAAAVSDLAARPDLRRELMVRWDGDPRALDPRDLVGLPDSIGLRLEMTESPAASTAPVAGDVEVHASDVDAAAEATAIERLGSWLAVERVVVTWPGAPARDAIERRAVAASGRAADAFRRMRLDPRLADAAQRSRPDPRTAVSAVDRLPRSRFEPLVRDAAGTTLLWGASDGDRMLLVLDARVTDPLALWSLRVLHDASRTLDGWPRPAARWTAPQLAAAQRPAPPVLATAPAGLDARWWWLAVLVLLLIEGVARRQRAQPMAQPGTLDDAA